MKIEYRYLLFTIQPAPSFLSGRLQLPLAAVLEIPLSDGIVGVGLFPDLDVSDDLRVAGFDQR